MAVLAAAILSPAESPKASSPGRPRGPADCSLKTVTDPTSKVVVNRLPKDRHKGKIPTALATCNIQRSYAAHLIVLTIRGINMLMVAGGPSSVFPLQTKD
ncbi:hypothetical protein FPQ18DRAFT_396667 [Pyronema domesticum]|nr:hypothetical protein FPQ18DRAFT_396667 [Pyronema domesticum]